MSGLETVHAFVAACDQLEAQKRLLRSAKIGGSDRFTVNGLKDMISAQEAVVAGLRAETLTIPIEQIAAERAGEAVLR